MRSVDIKCRRTFFFQGHRKYQVEASVNLARVAIRLGETFPRPDSMSAAVIDRLVERTQRRLGSQPQNFLVRPLHFRLRSIPPKPTHNIAISLKAFRDDPRFAAKIFVLLL